MHQQYFQQHVHNINQALESYLASRSESTIITYPKLAPLIQEFVSANDGGKRLRAVLVMMWYEMVTGHHNHDLLPVALAYELFQTGILAHDDIIDLSDLRRGKPTLHKAIEARWAQELWLWSKSWHYGISQSICLADIGMFLANKMIVDSKLSAEIKILASQSFLQSCIDTGLGEILDVEIENSDHNTITESDIISMYRSKTAHYTITWPLLLGAICAGADEETCKGISIFGDNLGIAFQIKDDEIGIYQDESVSGKSATSDIVEGKYTVLYHHALQHGTDEQVTQLMSLYGHEVGIQEHQIIKDLFEQIGSKWYCEEQIASYVEAALEYIPYLTPHPAYREYLNQLASFMINRTK
jgi:geranylgeranyl diphosphate synthase, type I